MFIAYPDFCRCCQKKIKKEIDPKKYPYGSYYCSIKCYEKVFTIVTTK
jgi:hypothetical protein